MGNYRPKHDAVQRGGKTGRPKLLHNGTGHGLTGGGGLNAKGTGGGIKVNSAMKPMQRQLRKSKYQANKHNAMKINEREKNRAKRAETKTQTQAGPVMNPHPVGSFMYGNDQWGTINKLGKVDWTATKPRAGAPIIGFNQALPWLKRTPHMTTVAQQFLQKRAVKPAQYHDPIYARFMAQAKLQRDQGLVGLTHQQNQVDHDYNWALKDLNNDYGDNVAGANTAIGAGNIAGSGVASAQLGELAEALQNAFAQNEAQKNLTNTEISTGQQQLKDAFDVEKAGQEGQARERWLATHQGQKLPESKNKKVYTEGGITYRQNEHGIPQTWTQKAKPKKPLHPNAKTFTSGGKVHQIKKGK